MVKYGCATCGKSFTQKGHYDIHQNRKRPCKKDDTLDKLVEQKVQEALAKMNSNVAKIDTTNTIIMQSSEMTDNKQTTEQVREAGLDKFYTIPAISEKCLNTIGAKYDWKKWDLVVEPSAGNGSFLTKIPTTKKVGVDIDPEQTDIIKKDFFEYKPQSGLSNILVVGNPPFGRVSSLAVKFFNHSAEWCNVIAFIIPKTFRRVSLQNRLHRKFHLVHDDEIPSEPCSFSPPMQVKCCFQIWEKKAEDRDLVKLSTKHADWDFLPYGPLDKRGQPTPPKGADFVVLAYGGKCGSIVKTGLDTLSPKSWHWVKAKISVPLLIERFGSLDYSLSKDTARQNSIGRGELVKLYSESYD
jgi:predicted RNA methylase